MIEDELQSALLVALAHQTGTVACATLEFCFPPSFVGFQGHFPDDPILPGVCLLQSLRLGLERAWSSRLKITEILNAKFVAPVHPGDTISFAVTETTRSAHAVFTTARVTRRGQRVAELSVKLESISPS
jgi:3-hydroxyacyl-[acyl-carrier-protein] dehydratase